jgi:hypothetical protein
MGSAISDGQSFTTTWIVFGNAPIWNSKASKINAGLTVPFRGTLAELVATIPNDGDSVVLPFANWALFDGSSDGILTATRYSSTTITINVECDTGTSATAWVATTATDDQVKASWKYSAHAGLNIIYSGIFSRTNPATTAGGSYHWTSSFTVPAGTTIDKIIISGESHSASGGQGLTNIVTSITITNTTATCNYYAQGVSTQTECYQVFRYIVIGN